MNYSHKTLDELEQLVAAGDANAQCFFDEVITSLKPLIVQLLEQLKASLCKSLTPFREWWRSTFAPGTFYGDVIPVYAHQDVAALERLARRKEFSRKALFWPARWETLQPAFRQRQERWPSLVQANLYPAILDCLRGDTRLNSIYQILRRETRKRIENDLLGTTIAQAERESPWPEEDTPEAIGFELELRRQAGQLGDPPWEEAVHLVVALGRLAEHEQAAILAQFEPGGDAALARERGVKEVTVRKWRAQGMKKLY